jgi:hypothetical protein
MDLLPVSSMHTGIVQRRVARTMWDNEVHNSTGVSKMPVLSRPTMLKGKRVAMQRWDGEGTGISLFNFRERGRKHGKELDIFYCYMSSWFWDNVDDLPFVFHSNPVASLPLSLSVIVRRTKLQVVLSCFEKDQQKGRDGTYLKSFDNMQLHGLLQGIAGNR